MIYPPIPQRIGSFTMRLNTNYTNWTDIPSEECDGESNHHADEYWRARLGSLEEHYDWSSGSMQCFNKDMAFIQGDPSGFVGYTSVFGFFAACNS